METPRSWLHPTPVSSDGPAPSIGARAPPGTEGGARIPAFRWAWKLATVAGISIYVHGTFMLLVAFLAFSDLAAGQGARAILRSTALILAVFGTVVLHELGHALMARRFGIATKDITLLPIGGVARLERLPSEPGQQLQVALAGPAVNLMIAALLFGVVRVLDAPVGIDDLRPSGGPFLTQLMWINVSLALFNLLPGYPMDGGRVLRALLAMWLAPERATQLAARVGQVVAVAFVVLGLWRNPFLAVIGVFIWLGAQTEHALSTVKVALAGLSVRQGMITTFETLSPRDSLSKAVELTLAGFQQDFPVMDEARLVGVLTQGDLLKGLADRGRDMTVEHAMRSGLETASPRDVLDDALARLRQPDCRVLMVMENEKVIGLLTAGNIGELIAFDAAGQALRQGERQVGGRK